MDKIIEITFLRHGRSRADDEGVHEGRYDAPLTETGKAQARARGEGWLQAGVQFDRVICSPLQRARQSAEIVAACLNVPLETDPDWMELDNGPLAGLPYDVARERFPRPAFRGPFEPMCGSGESDLELTLRAARALERVIRRGPGRYLVVAHGMVLNAALRVVMGAPTPVNNAGIWFAFDDLGYARFCYDPGKHIWTMLEFR